jgi:hypothetical protein
MQKWVSYSVMAPRDRVKQQWRNTIVGFFMEKLAYMTQVSDVAPGPLVAVSFDFDWLILYCFPPHWTICQFYRGAHFLLVEERERVSEKRPRPSASKQTNSLKHSDRFNRISALFIYSTQPARGGVTNNYQSPKSCREYKSENGQTRLDIPEVGSGSRRSKHPLSGEIRVHFLLSLQRWCVLSFNGYFDSS